MTNGRANSCFDHKIVLRKCLGYLGVAFSTGHVAFFAYILMRIGTIKLVPILIFFSDVAAAILWVYGFYGVDINKARVMFIPLLCWGIPLSIWFDATFVVISQDISLTIGNIYRLDDIFIYTLTAFFIVFYFFLVMGYRAIKGSVQESIRKGDFDWKIVGLMVSWLICAYTVGQISYVTLLPYSLHSAHLYFVIFLISVLNVTVTLTWLYGIAKIKSKFILTSLFCWLASLILWFAFLAIYIYGKTSSKFSDDDHRRYGVLYATAFNISLLIVAALCFRAMKRDILESMRLNAVYTATSNESRELNAKCNLIKISEKRNEN